jgi:general secretion pathway protein D
MPVAFNLAANGVTLADGDKFQVVFDNADIGAVARAVLGDGLKVNYLVDPRVRGTITLSAQRPVSRSQLLWLLENALRPAGAILVQQEGVYRILPAADSRSVGAANIGPDAGAPGFGTTALPLQYISADTLSKILIGFGAAAESIKIDPSRNLLIVRGSTSERQWLIDTALAFDVDWMRNQTVGIFPVKNSSPEVVIKEIDQLAPESSLLKMQAITRLNSILVVAKNADTVRQVQTWVNRLDRRNDYGPGVHVYRLKSADARKVVIVLKEVFGSGGPGTTTEQTTVSGPTPIARLPGGGIPPVPTETTRQQTSASRTDQSAPGGGVENAPSRLRITADPASNAVVVYASTEEYKPIERAIIELDRPTPEVAIEAIAAEVVLNDTLNYGVQFFLRGAIRNASGNTVPTSGTQLNVPLPLAQMVPGANFAIGALANPSVVISALRDVTDVKILSSPSLVVANNQPALLQVGDQVPVTTGTATSVVTTQSAIVNSVSYVDTGVILRVTPHITRSGQVQLDIEQEVSAVAQNTNATTLTPTISQQKVKSTVVVENGQTVLLAGLISQQRNQQKSGIPGLIDVPILGNITSNATNTGKRSELIVFVQPRIIRNHIDAQMVAEDLRRRMPGFGNW